MSNIIEKGQEPERIKKRMDTLFAKLDEAYPDKVISGLEKDHKNWAETALEISRALGYESKNEFLIAYGYTIKKLESGRPSTVDSAAIIKTLQERYPNGSGFTKVDDLFAANPEFMPKLKTIKNTSNAVFGMPLGKYLLSIGLIKSKTGSKPEKPEKKKKVIICTVWIPGSEDIFYYLSSMKSLRKDDCVEVNVGVCENRVFGKVEETTVCDCESAPFDTDSMETIIRKVGTREYSKGIVRSVLHASAATASDLIICNSSVIDFQEASKTKYQFNKKASWAIIRGLSCEVMKVIDYLQKKDSLIYEIGDVILIEKGIAELIIYCDDIPDVMNTFPNVKMAMFAENEDTGIVELLYSGSGYPEVTGKYEVGICETERNNSWTLKHSPVENFNDGIISYEFKYRDDWIINNYVFTDKDGNKKQLVSEV